MQCNAVKWKWAARRGQLHQARDTVYWIEVKVAVFSARQYMLWNIFIIKVLNIFWYFKLEILTRICSEAFLKQYWRNCLQKLLLFYFFQTPFLELCLNYARPTSIPDSRVLTCTQNWHLNFNSTHCERAQWHHGPTY